MIIVLDKFFITSILVFHYAVDVLKVRLQLANAAMTTSQSTLKAGLIETTVTIFQREGIRAFYSGLIPAVLRGLFYGGVRLGIST